MSHGRRNKSYIPNPKFNPVVFGKKLEKLEQEVQHHKNLLESTNKANDLHVEHLSNFVRHDMKNAIQGLDGIIYNAKLDNQLPADLLQQFELSLSLLRSSLENFARLIPSTKENSTTLPKILNAVEMLTRSDMQVSRINIDFEYDRQSSRLISYPFQTLVQVIHNLVINAKNAVMEKEYKNILITGEEGDNTFTVKVYDNGDIIPPEKIPSIYKYGYSTTGGTGIGLFHAKSVVEDLSGSIDMCKSDRDQYTKFFIITLNSFVK